jgi:PAS domain S-box-containing protein
MRRSSSRRESEDPEYPEESSIQTAAPDSLASAILALEQSPAALGLATLAGDLLYLNTKAEELFGVSPGAELPGRNFAEVCTQRVQLGVLEAVARDGRERQIHLVGARASGGTGRYLCKLRRLSGYGGIPTWLSFVALEYDGGNESADTALDDMQSMRVIHRLAGMATWKMRLDDRSDWTNNPVQWGAGIYPLLNLKSDAPLATLRSYLDFVARPDRPGIRAAMDEALADGSRFEAIYRLNPRGGATKLVLSRAVPVADESTNFVPMMWGVVQDITSVFAGQMLPYEKAAILDTFAQNLEAPLYAVDRDFRYTFFNPFFESMMRRLYGVTPAIGERAFESISSAPRRKTVLANLRRALSGARVVEEVAIRLDDAIVRTFELTYSPMRGSAASSGVTVFGARAAGAATGE